MERIRESHILAPVNLNADVFQHNRLIIFRQVFATVNRRIIGEMWIRNCNSNVQHFTENLQIQSIISAKGSQMAA
jgi:hypothetical protein